MTEDTIIHLGRVVVRIIIPSRRMDGQILDPDLRKEWDGRARALLEEIIGGATPRDEVGSFAHSDGRVTREKITVLEASTSAETLRDTQRRDRFLDFGKEICKALGQELIFISWVDDSYLVGAKFNAADIGTIAFKQLRAEEQARFLYMGWGGVNHPAKIRQLLSLDGWGYPSEDLPTVDGLFCVAELAGDKPIRAWVSNSTWEQSKKVSIKAIKSGILNDGDLVFTQSRENYLAFGGVSGGVMLGPKELAITHAQMNLVTRELLLAILHREWTLLQSYLKQKPLNEDFFPKIQSIQAKLEAHCKKTLGKEAFRFSVLVVGRMMFLRFLIEKGWIEAKMDVLIACFASNRKDGKNFFEKTIRPLWFDGLNTPETERPKDKVLTAFGKIPYLNGGLFKARVWEKKAKIPDEFFDPDKEGSFLQLLRDYEFSLNEYAGSDESLKVDPSIFGLVLECFNSDREKKNSGIHYTPKSIAMALAMEGIVNRLESLTHIPAERLRRFSEGDMSVLEEDEADAVKAALENLRIIDPAVGSGVLLWACLESLLTIGSLCDGRISGNQGVQRGSFKWGQLSRHFVSNSLFGVDVSEEAVELTRLRLWLAVAMSESKPSPLPDLELNIVQGDSLAVAPRDSNGKTEQGELGFDYNAQALQSYKAAIHHYHSSAGKPQLESIHLAKVKKLRAKLSHLPGIGQAVEMPLDWDISFATVMHEAKKGFDLVIANPPYVRIQKLERGALERYKNSWETMRSGNTDLCYAFIELALRKLAAPEQGQIAFIQPAFSQVDSAESLRNMLIGRNENAPARIKLWVDFGHNQVFPTATNYVALLFAERLDRVVVPEPFSFSIPEKGKPWEDKITLDWIRPPDATHTHPATTSWLFMPTEDREVLHIVERSAGTLLGSIADVCVGVQTSADKVFLFWQTRPSEKGSQVIEAYSDHLKKWVVLETAILRPCRKGAVKERPSMLFPYEMDRGGTKILNEPDFSKRFPLAYQYLRLCEKKLAARKLSPNERDPWYCFGRKQGFLEVFKAKVLVPAILRELDFTSDPDGELTFTASGKGGGGCWAVIPKDSGLSVAELHSRLNTPEVWTQIMAYGSRQQGGWLGVDKGVLAKLKI